MSRRAIRILFVEDSSDDIFVANSALQRAGLACEIAVASDERTLLTALQSYAPDVVLSDLSLPNFSGAAAFDLVHRFAPQVPFIFWSGALPTRSAQRALAGGAAAYIEKNDFNALIRLLEDLQRP